MVSSSSGGRLPRRQPTSFLGGPFLLDTLHQLPPSLVQLVFSFPSLHPTINHTDLVSSALGTLVNTTDETIKQKLATWTPEHQKLVRKRALRHSALRQLALDWALDERVRDLDPAYDPAVDPPEQLVLALVGAIKQHLGDNRVQSWLRIVTETLLSEAFDHVQAQLASEPARSPNVPSLPSSYSPLQPEQPTFQIPPPPRHPPPPLPPPAAPPPPPAADEPPTTYSLVKTAVNSLPTHVLEQAFTHPSVNPVANFVPFATAGLAFLRSVVQRILLDHPDVDLNENQRELLIDASVAPDTIRPLAVGWELDKPARSRRAPDVFASSQTETLFFSLIGATKAAFGDDHCGGWLMQVMGEYVRQTYETVGQQIRDQDAALVASRQDDHLIATMVKAIPPSGFDYLVTNLPPPNARSIDFPSFHFFRVAATASAQKIFEDLPGSLGRRLVNEALSDEVLCSRALELGLDQHPRLAGRVPAQQMGSALLAVCRASYSHHQSSEAFTRLVRLIMDPILKKMAADATSQGRNVPMPGPRSAPSHHPSSSSNTREESQRPDRPPMPAIFYPASDGPKKLQTLLSWITPATLNVAFSHKSVAEVDYQTLLPDGVTMRSSFLYATVSDFIHQWYDGVLPLGPRNSLITTVFGSAGLFRLASELGIPSKIHADPPSVASLPYTVRDVFIALVEGARKDVSRDAISKWIGSTFRPYVDQLKLHAPPLVSKSFVKGSDASVQAGADSPSRGQRGSSPRGKRGGSRGGGRGGWKARGRGGSG